MRTEFHRDFKKRYKKIPQKIRDQFDLRMRLFENNPFHSQLHNHPLSSNRKGQWSINITGDWRAIYMWASEENALFLDIDTHSNLYK